MPVDYSKYPKNWLSEIRPRILKRANYCCELNGCNFKHGDRVHSVVSFETGKRVWINNDSRVIDYVHVAMTLNQNYKPLTKVFKVVLTIAHLDHDETNMNVTDDRLMAMCQKCHLQYDAEEKKRRKLLKKANSVLRLLS